MITKYSFTFKNGRRHEKFFTEEEFTEFFNVWHDDIWFIFKGGRHATCIYDCDN